MRKFFITALLFVSSFAHSQLYVKNASATQLAFDNYVAQQSISFSKAARVKAMIGEIERSSFADKIIALYDGTLWDNTNHECRNLMNTQGYDGAFRLTQKSGSVTPTATGIRIHSGDTLNTHFINDILSDDYPYPGFFYVTDTIVNKMILYSQSPFALEPNFAGKAYVSIWASATGISYPISSGFHLAQRKNNDTVELYQNTTRYTEALAVNSTNPQNNETYIIGNTEASYNLQIAGICSALTQAEAQQLYNIIQRYLNGTNSFFESTGNPTPGIVTIKTSQGQFNVGANDVLALDDLRGFVIDDSLHVIAGTDNFNTFNEHSVSADKGLTWTYKANAPWTDRNAMGTASDRKNKRGVMWAGQRQSGLIFNDSWEYKPATGWTMITNTMVGFNNAVQFAHASTSQAWGAKYLTIGGTNQNDIKSSSDLITWTSVTTLPVSIQNVRSMSADVDTINGVLLVTGGLQNSNSSHPSKLWKFQLNTSGVPTLIDSLQDAIFGDDWEGIKWCTSGWILTRGTNETNNIQGVYYCPQNRNPLIRANWIRLRYEIQPRHAPAIFANKDKTEIFLVMGNFWNESQLIKPKER